MKKDGNLMVWAQMQTLEADEDAVSLGLFVVKHEDIGGRVESKVEHRADQTITQ